MIKNQNAKIGTEGEKMFEDSICNQPEVIEKLKLIFKIKGSYKNTSGGGIYGDKSDVRINFDCGHYIEANIKSYKGKGFNQITRTSVANFSKNFDTDEMELANVVIEKSKSPKNPLFPIETREKWGRFFEENKRDILKWAFSSKVSREILVLHNRDTKVFRIYAMKDVLKALYKEEIVFTKGGLNFGDCISFQRKGGNGSLSKNINKTDIKHPGNNIQLKIKAGKFVQRYKNIELAEYSLKEYNNY